MRSAFGLTALLVVATSSVTACGSTVEERIIVPRGYRGPVVVVFGDPTGIDDTVVDGVRSLHVGEDGMLFVRGSKPERWRISVYTGNDRLTASESANPASTELQAYGYVNASSTPVDGGQSVGYYTLFVGVPATDDAETLRRRAAEMIDSAAVDVRARRAKE